MIQDPRAKIKSVKYTNNSTVLFVDEKEDHKRIMQRFKDENIAHHTFTNITDKSQAFVLRGLAEGTKPLKHLGGPRQRI